VRVGPDRRSVLAEVAGQRPSRQRFARVPLALAFVQKASWREAVVKPLRQARAVSPFRWPHRFGVPFRTVGVVCGHEGRLAAHREPDVALRQSRVDAVAERLDGAPRLVAVRQGDSGRLGDSLHGHRERELFLDLIVLTPLVPLEAARDRRRGRRVRSARERDMTLSRQEPARGIEPDPSRTREKYLRPCVQVGCVLTDAGGPADRLFVCLELDRIPGHEAGREAELP
jgi:hypothetical protein